VRPDAVAFDLQPRTKSLDAVATRVITGTSHWTVLLFLPCWLASAGGLDCGRAVVLPPKKDIKEFSIILPPPKLFEAASIWSAIQVLMFSLFLFVIVCICVCLTRFLYYRMCVCLDGCILDV